MAKRKKRKRKAHEKGTVALGLAWYSRDQWERLLEVSVDRDMLEPTYEEWKANAESGLPKLKKPGVVVHKIDVDVEELVRWCNARGYLVDAKARSLFAAAKVREMNDRE